ncbi:MAG TPA: BatD family protein [Verrucomicrobiota bacterium]|nr:BatD family protein [Verrucomicrobiota bacterium]HNU52940.1 BatD family protein [Verrucomicrobiota bacterium]
MRRAPGGRALLAVLLSVAAALGSGVARGASLTATLDRSIIRIGEAAKLSLQFENCQPAEAPNLPDVPNLQFTYSGQGSSFRLENGRQTALQTLYYFVMASQPGDYTIPAFAVPIGTDRLSTSPLTLKVLKSNERLPDEDLQTQAAFLKLVVPKTEAYVGEVVPVDIQLYVVSGEGLQLEPLTGEGFTFGKLQQLPQRQVQVGNRTFALVALRTTAVANKTGELQLGPAECRLNLRVPTGRRRPRGVFDDMFGDMFAPTYELRPTRLASDPVRMTVRPLPAEGRPEGFTGTVGEYAMQVSVGPTNVAVGEPITLKLRVAGKGALDGIRLPPLPAWPGFASYPPTSQVETTDPLGIEGSKTFEFDVVPQTNSVTAVPALGFSFFNPVRKVYERLTHPATPIIVRPAGAAMALPPIAANTPAGTPVMRDIVPLKQRLGTLSVIGPPLHRSTRFLAVQMIPLILFAAAWGWRRRLDHLARNPRVVRRRAVARLIRESQAELRRAAAAGDADGFCALALRLLQERIGERLDQPAAAITDAVVEEQLRPRGVPEEVLSPLRELFLACNEQRYAPGSARLDLAVLTTQLESVLRQLNKLSF